jgi:Rnl2 family RNA ligase
MPKSEVKSKSSSAWSKYESIESVDNSCIVSLLHAVDTAHHGVEWVATEKVHGANFAFETDGEFVEYASRVQKIGANADFYNALSTMPKYHPFVLEAFRLAKVRWPDVQRLVIYGEYFGGYYPGHKTPGLKKVQGGVAYSPDHHFYAFDVFSDSTGYLNFDESREILLSAGFPLVMAALMRGKLNEVLAFDVEVLRTQVPALLGLPPIDEFQVAEGIVLRPVESIGLIKGKRAILKKKARAFWEATNQHGVLAKKALVPADAGLLTPEGVAIETVKGFVTANRLRAVISKSPDLLEEQQMPKLKGLFAKDVINDFENLHPDLCTGGKDTVKTLKKAAHYMVAKFVDEHIKDIREDVG